MNSKQWMVLGFVMAMLGGAAWLLIGMGAKHRLGPPGVKVVTASTFTDTGRLLHTNSVFLPPTLPDWTSEPTPITELEANWLPKDTLFGRRTYTAKDGFQVWLSVVLMGTDRTSIHKPQYCLESQGCRIQTSEVATVPMARPHPYDLRVMKLTTARQVNLGNGQVGVRRGLYLYWFVADGLLTPTHGQRMWWMARDLIRTGVLDRWGYISYFTEFWPGEDEAALNRLKEFIANSAPQFQLATGSNPNSTLTTTSAALAGGNSGSKN